MHIRAAHQGKGWADYIRQWLVQTAAAEFRVKYVGVEILRNNVEHLDRWLHRTPPGWRRVGEIEIPAPGGVFFACPATPNRTEYGRSERP